MNKYSTKNNNETEQQRKFVLETKKSIKND